MKVELVEPDGMPAKVKVAWPPRASLVDPKDFPDVAATMVKLFSEAHVSLARIKARRRL